MGSIDITYLIGNGIREWLVSLTLKLITVYISLPEKVANHIDILLIDVIGPFVNVVINHL